MYRLGNKPTGPRKTTFKDMKTGDIGVITGDSIYKGEYVVRGGGDNSSVIFSLSNPRNHWLDSHSGLEVSLLQEGEVVTLTVE